MTMRSDFFDVDYLCHEKLKTRRHKKKDYLNVSASFDIEATSFYENKCKRAIMYCFVFGLNGKVAFGRTWDDFIGFLKALQNAYDLNENKILPVYVHNLSYEFQFMRKKLKWLDFFATDDRKPVRCLCEYGIEFRDSLILSGQGLDATAKNLQKYKIEKLMGALDYSKLRHSSTRLTPKEWHYVENDGLTLMAFIQEEIERNSNNITFIPMTKTGYVRKFVKAETLHGGQKGHGERRKVKTNHFSRYRKLMKMLTLSKDCYLSSMEAFQGGFTHANSFNVGLIHENVASEDLTSAYPSSIALDYYPMGEEEFIKKPSKAQMRESLRNYCSIFEIALKSLKSKFKGDNFISYSKCRNVKNAKIDNGRIFQADYLEMTITEIDFDVYLAFYDFEVVSVKNLHRFPRGYLPKDFIKAVLTLYKDKTELKDVEGEEGNYLIKKELLNSCYGMMVTAIQRPQSKYVNDEWIQEFPSLDKVLEDYNNSWNRFLFYTWGIYVTAHIRRTIAKAVLELGDDYVYSDTDSVKFMNFEKHKAYFDRFNENILAKIRASMKHTGLDISYYIPKTKEGKEKPIGFFDYEGTYKRFKTLGAKRYFVEYQEPKKLGKIKTPYSLTISGVNKKTAIPRLIEEANKEKKDIFDYFEIGFEFDETMSGKNARTYCDYAIEGDLIDYQGNPDRYKEDSFIHLEATTYKITTTEEYLDTLLLDKIERIERRENILK